MYIECLVVYKMSYHHLVVCSVSNMINSNHQLHVYVSAMLLICKNSCIYNSVMFWFVIRVRYLISSIR